jgi:hypothetical protein
MYDGVVELSKGDFDLLKEVLGEWIIKHWQ